jgi:hypothetical protein
MQAAMVTILMIGVVQANPVERAETDGREVIVVGQSRATSSFHPAVQPRRDHGFVDSALGSIWPLPQIRYSSRLGFRPEKRWNPNSPDGYYFHCTYNYRVEFDYPWHAAPRAYRVGCP